MGQGRLPDRGLGQNLVRERIGFLGSGIGIVFGILSGIRLGIGLWIWFVIEFRIGILSKVMVMVEAKP